MEGQKINRVGETRLNNQGSLMKIVEYNNAKNIVIEFQDEHKAKMQSTYNNFKHGEVKNVYFPDIYNIGCIGNTATSINGETKESYKKWNSMMIRCYSEKYHKNKPIYKDCIVCKDWLCYENFEKWYDENYYEIGNETMCIDKDILKKGNKTYSPETCLIVPKLINALFTNRKNDRGEYPVGVTCKKGKYIARCNNGNNIRVSLGSFDSPTDAFYAYKKYKEKIIKEIANDYKDKIPEELYNAMLNYKIEITD